MIENFSQLITILLQTVIVLIVLLLLYIKFIFSIFDPLFYFVLTQAFSIELGIIQIQDPVYLQNFLACQFFFAVGFRLCAKKIGIKKFIDDHHISFDGFEYNFWYLFTIIGAIIIILANFYLISKQGIILLSKNPTAAKVAAFDGGEGLGAIRRINWGLSNFVNVTCIFLYVKTKQKKFIFILLVLVLIALSGGAKSSLLIYVSIIALLGLFESLRNSSSFRLIDKLKIPILVAGLVFAFFILGFNSFGLTDTFRGLVLRFLYFGDIILYYYKPQAVNYFQQLGILDFFSYELNPILGLIRLVPYVQPLGFEMVKFSLTKKEIHDTVMGPNLPYYVKGHIFFGPYGALVYSMLVGMLIGFVRGLLAKPFKYYSQYIIIIFFNILIFSYAQDSSFTMTIFIDTLIFATIPIFLSLLLLISPLKNKLAIN